MRWLVGLVAVAAVLSSASARAVDWPTLTGNVERSGYVEGRLGGPARVAWAVGFAGERIGTAVEPIVAEGRVFIATHAGHVWALAVEGGKPIWMYDAGSPLLHSPAWAAGSLFAADADGRVHAINPITGAKRWRTDLAGESFSISPAVINRTVLIGSRGGVVYALHAGTGATLWKRPLNTPIRQTMALRGEHAFVTGEDLRLRCLDIKTGEIVWTTQAMAGQSARDYYPVLSTVGGRTVVIVRTSPSVAMPQRLGQDRGVLTTVAGIDGSSWKSIDAWTKDPKNLGSPELWEKERLAVLAHLSALPQARTFFVFDGETGRPLADVPVLWAGGCQGVGAPPAVLPDGRLFVEYRSAYGNWNLGVAPFVAVGILDPATSAVEHLSHANGTPNAPWNTYWGTADEAKHFQLVGDWALFVHQGTLCGFDLKTRALTTLQGDRDTFGGYLGLPWARNEWHGPARAGAAVVGRSLYWISGSRVFRLDLGQTGPKPNDQIYLTTDAPVIVKADPPSPDAELLANAMIAAVDELLSKQWAPFIVEPGIAGRDIAFAQSGEVIESLAWAYPHLPVDRQAKVRKYLADLLKRYPPLRAGMGFDPAEGDRREETRLAPESFKTRGDEPTLQPFGNVYAVTCWAERAGDKELLDAEWSDMRAAFADFQKTQWSLDPAVGHLFANRYLASLLAYRRIANSHQDDSALAAAQMSERTAAALGEWWKRAAVEQRAMAGIEGVAKLDQFIGRGGGVFLRLTPHRHKLALFRDLTPHAVEAVAAHEPAATMRAAWEAFVAVAPTWHLVGEERQVHYGENAYDPPDFSLGAFRMAACLGAGKGDLIRFADRPWGRADVYFIAKAGAALDAK